MAVSFLSTTYVFFPKTLSIMFFCRLILLLLMTADFITSKKDIIAQTNATDVYEGMPVKLSCNFIDIPNIHIISWKSVDGTLSRSLICRSDSTCNEIEGYKLSRKKGNITMVIEKANISARKWECGNYDNSYSRIITLNITANPALEVEITEEKSHYRISTSCSSFFMNVSCDLDGKSLQIKDLQSKKCSHPSLSYSSGIIKPSDSGLMKCIVAVNGKEVTKIKKLNNGMFNCSVCIECFSMSITLKVLFMFYLF